MTGTLSGEVHYEASVPGPELPPLKLHRTQGPEGFQSPHDGQGLRQDCRLRIGQVEFFFYWHFYNVAKSWCR